MAQGLRTIVSSLLTEYAEPSKLLDLTQRAGVTWVVGDRVVTLGPLLYSLIELGFVVTVALLVMRYRGARP